ncbi:putative transcriptional regulatory protein C3C7.04 [Fusarium austroafricanum]|uniref:Putative transcriptional regulatory protein C3C7.04 n=1 Tax=Fusarium austroafricanum TaxID=2364996 RepID=A0A8H4KPZ1_9HYPO|nr:putative transcriptional regulatory protein C3C7.04 [Fusarium austroafricanum]
MSPQAAITSRVCYAAMYEARFRELDALCQKLQVVATQLTQAVAKLPQGSCEKSCPHHSPCASAGVASQTRQYLGPTSVSESGDNLAVQDISQSQPNDGNQHERNGDSGHTTHHGSLGTNALKSLVNDSYGIPK